MAATTSPNHVKSFSLGARRPVEVRGRLLHRRRKSFSASASEADFITFEVDDKGGSGRPLVKAGTREMLIDQLLDFRRSGEEDANYISEFILTYEYFMTPTELLELLQSYFRCEMPPLDPSLTPVQRKLIEHGFESAQRRIVKVLKTWIDIDPADFFYTEDLESKLLEFLDDAIMETRDEIMLSDLQLISRRIVLLEPDEVKSNTPLDQLYASYHRNPAPPPTFVLLDVDKTVLAQQLTLIDYAMYKQVKPTECLWLGRDKEEVFKKTAPNFSAWINHFNKLSDWVAGIVVQTTKLATRVSVIEYFIALAVELFHMQNFNSCVAVVTGLSCNSTDPVRLSKTWAKVSPASRMEYQYYNDIFMLKPNFSVYDLEIESNSVPPLVPIAPAHKKWLVMVDMLNSNETEDMLINFAKMRMIGKRVSRFMSFQSTPFVFEEVPELLEYLFNIEAYTMTRDEAYEASKKIEAYKGPPPRSASNSPAGKK